jgi:UDP-N-acetyl-D-galactosamine dehydrogenase
MYEKLLKKETKLSLVGLGYVGLPIALEFAKKIKVVVIIRVCP